MVRTFAKTSGGSGFKPRNFTHPPTTPVTDGEKADTAEERLKKVFLPHGQENKAQLRL